MPLPLPPACRWVHVSADEALMHFNYGSVAHVTPGQLWLWWRDCTIKASHPGSLRQGMRFAERWIAARTGLPGARKMGRRCPDDGERWIPLAGRLAAYPSRTIRSQGISQEEMMAMEGSYRLPHVLSNDVWN